MEAIRVEVVAAVEEEGEAGVAAADEEGDQIFPV